MVKQSRSKRLVFRGYVTFREGRYKSSWVLFNPFEKGLFKMGEIFPNLRG